MMHFAHSPIADTIIAIGGAFVIIGMLLAFVGAFLDVFVL